MSRDRLDALLERNRAAEADLVDRVRAEGVEFVYYQFVTLNARVMAKVAPATHLSRNLFKGVQFHGSAVADLATSRHGTLIASSSEAEEFVAIPDAATFAVLPWDRRFARMYCFLFRRPDRASGAGEPLPTCVRSNLARVHEEFIAATGYELRTGTEPEMSWFGDDIQPISPPNVSPAYHIGALEMMRPIASQVVGYAQALGLDMIEGDYEDTAQLELNFMYDRAERTCDNLTTYRLVCAQVAKEHGVIASFMPKPAVGAMANGCHHNLSLWAGDTNALEEPGITELHVSEVAKHALGGILTHSRGALAVLAPTVNSYARYSDVGQFAPTIANWGYDNRTCAVRISANGRLEYKLPDASVNPYLSHAVILRVVADGLARRLDPGPPQSGDSYDDAVVAADRAARGIPPLPKTLGEALAALESDDVVRSAMTDELYAAFVEYKTDEWERFCGTVTEWHREMYLRAIP